MPGASVAGGGDPVRGREVGLSRRDAAPVGPPGRAECGRARSCATRRRILPRRSSTAARNDGRVHRRPSGPRRGRADLRGAADRPLDVLSSSRAGRPTRRAGRPEPSAMTHCAARFSGSGTRTIRCTGRGRSGSHGDGRADARTDGPDPARRRRGRAGETAARNQSREARNEELIPASPASNSGTVGQPNPSRKCLRDCSNQWPGPT